MIRVQDLTKTYSLGEVEIRALRGVSFEIADGDLVAIMGPSGSGKSTLMNVLGCLDKRTSGLYELDGTDVGKLSDNQLAGIRNRKIGFVFQNFNLLTRLTAVENVELPLVYRGGNDRRKRALAALEAVGLADRAGHRLLKLSGGQQQRVAIARALVAEPTLILADEPTGNLDSHTSREIIGLFQDLNRRRGITVVFVTHDPSIVKRTRRVITIRDGLIESDEAVQETTWEREN